MLSMCPSLCTDSYILALTENITLGHSIFKQSKNYSNLLTKHSYAENVLEPHQVHHEEYFRTFQDFPDSVPSPITP